MLQRFFFTFATVTSLGLAMPLAVAQDAGPAAGGIEFFERKVRPVLAARCFECHGPNSEGKGGLRLGSLAGLLKGGGRGPAIVPGKPDESRLVQAINYGDMLKMPPKAKLPPQEIGDLTAWVKMGAPWPDAEPAVPAESREPGAVFSDEERSFWAFQPPADPAVPAVKMADWPRSPLDHFILAALEAKGLHPAPAADKRTLIRRATFDLSGLPPTPEEVAAFLADESPDAFAKVVDRLLGSLSYGERWGRHWLDVARYADSNGMDENLAFANAFRYRDYVIAAFNQDKPYDQFVREQLAGDLLPSGDSEARRLECLVATGFLSLGPKMLAEDDPVKMEMDIIDEQVDTIGRAFMGLTLGCARCHDHKYDPIRTADYYALAGIFKSTKTMENFKVVAQWHERPLAPGEEQAAAEAHEKKIVHAKEGIKSRANAANEPLLTEARRHIAPYLLAATQLLEQEAAPPVLKSLMAQPNAGDVAGVILVEAEAYVRGNVKKDFSVYGDPIGVIYNQGELPNVAEYEIEVAEGGHFQLELRYAAAESRPVRLLINGQLVKSDAAGKVTGSWTPETQTWGAQGIFGLQAGRNTILLERS